MVPAALPDALSIHQLPGFQPVVQRAFPGGTREELSDKPGNLEEAAHGVETVLPEAIEEGC